MQERRWRPKFVNPFGENKSNYRAFFRGFFREMPLHQWSPTSVTRVLHYAATNPKRFGFPDRPTCIVNPLLLTRNIRSRQLGVSAFGIERGCKTIVVPPSTSGGPYDEVDAKLLEPLLKRNPSLEYLYLSRDCIPMVPHLIPALSQLRNIKHIVLPGWNDAVAIHKVVMACKQCEIIDSMSMEMVEQDWTNEGSVQALCTLIEMHPKLRVVLGTRKYLAHWYNATYFSRCKFNVALMMDTCEASVVLFAFWYVATAACLCFVLYNCAVAMHFITGDFQRLIFVILLSCIAIGDFAVRRSRGRLWIHGTKCIITGLHRIAHRGGLR